MSLSLKLENFLVKLSSEMEGKQDSSLDSHLENILLEYGLVIASLLKTTSLLYWHFNDGPDVFQ